MNAPVVSPKLKLEASHVLNQIKSGNISSLRSFIEKLDELVDLAWEEFESQDSTPQVE